MWTRTLSAPKKSRHRLVPHSCIRGMSHGFGFLLDWLWLVDFGFALANRYRSSSGSANNVSVLCFSQGHDLLTLLYNFMDECLLKFCLEEMIICRVDVAGISQSEEKKQFTIKATVHGERWDLQKHPQGTEVKVCWTTCQCQSWCQ